MFHRVGAAAYKANLNNSIAIDRLLNHPHKNYKTIHIAGTNGKGSTSHMLAAILQQAGYRTGLFTSPHLKDFRERIRVNGKMISKKYVTDFVNQYREEFESIKPSFFEWTAGLAFKYFEHKKVDVAVVETGLGGRIDSTNIIIPVLSVITNIGWDHMNLLGNSLQKIAGEKAGIIKKNVPVVVGESHHITKKVFIRKAREVHSPIVFADKNYTTELKKDLTLKKGVLTVDIKRGNKIFLSALHIDLTGHYQLKNISTVLQSVEIMQDTFDLSINQIRAALKQVKKMTGLHGRWQIISKNPVTICDTGHNYEGIKEVLKQVGEMKYGKLHFVFGMVNDKDISKILKLLPESAAYYFCRANIPRGLDANLLFEAARKTGLKGIVCDSVNEALKKAQQQAGKNDLVFVGGSTFTVAEVI